MIAAGIRPEVDARADRRARGRARHPRRRRAAHERPGRARGRRVRRAPRHRLRALGAAAASRRGARRLARGAAGGVPRRAPATTLKVAGVELFCCGRVTALRAATRRCSRSTRAAAATGACCVRDGRLAGAILLGDLRDAPRLRELAPAAPRCRRSCWTPARERVPELRTATSWSAAVQAVPRATIAAAISAERADDGRAGQPSHAGRHRLRRVPRARAGAARRGRGRDARRAARAGGGRRGGRLIRDLLAALSRRRAARASRRRRPASRRPRART